MSVSAWRRRIRRVSRNLCFEQSAQCCGTRYWRGVAVPGGLRFDLDSDRVAQLGQAVARAARDFSEIARMIVETPSIQNRFETAGVLSREAARDLAVVGPVARASGIDLDVRRDHPYGLYGKHQIDVPSTHYGDVMARARIRIAEAAVSAQHDSRSRQIASGWKRVRSC